MVVPVAIKAIRKEDLDIKFPGYGSVCLIKISVCRFLTKFYIVLQIVI